MFLVSTSKLGLVCILLLTFTTAKAQDPKGEDDKEKTTGVTFTFQANSGEKSTDEEKHQPSNKSKVFFPGKKSTSSGDDTHVIVTSNGNQTSEGAVFVFRASSNENHNNPFILEFKPNHGFLGIESVELTDDLRLHFGAPQDAGIMIGRVTADGPAGVAGFQVGDILTHLNGEPITNSGQLLKVLIAKKPGEEVEAELWREGVIIQANVVLGEFESKGLLDFQNNAKADVLLAPEGQANFFINTWPNSEKPKLEWVQIDHPDLHKKLEVLQQKIEELEIKINEQKEKQ